MTAAVNHALEAAILRAYALGRVDQSIVVAAKELKRMVAADPSITPWRILRLYGVPAKWSSPDWDHALWAVADVWCEIQGRPARKLLASPYSPLRYVIPAREEATTQR